MQDDLGIQWAHSHDFGVDDSSSESKVRVVFALTTVVMVLEIGAGVWSGSMALLADGWHMGTHSVAFAITMFAYFYAKKHANNRAFSFGTGKVNYLGGFASAIALAIVALMMAIESVQRLFEPHTIHFDEAIMVAIIGLTVNIASVFLLHDGHHHDHDHHHHSDQNMKAAYFHVLADTLTSVLAIVALLAGKFYGWIWMDSLVGIIGAVVISRWSYVLIRESSEVLLDKSEGYPSLAKAIDAIAAGNETVIKDIHIWKIASIHRAAILSVAAKNPLEPNEYKAILKQCVPRLSHVSIEIQKL